ncbi:hypothetical protein FUA08_12130 [Escherichia coli]|nr:hypothetical protein [Escherichia coli]EFD5423357.1 hypothetical protein [Escherichia coli]
MRWWKKLDYIENDNHYRFCGSFPAIRAVTGRRPRGFSLFMKIFQGKSCRYFSNITFCFFLYCIRKGPT